MSSFVAARDCSRWDRGQKTRCPTPKISSPPQRTQYLLYVLESSAGKANSGYLVVLFVSVVYTCHFTLTLLLTIIGDILTSACLLTRGIRHTRFAFWLEYTG